jgi:hypothetical protein
LKADDSTLLSGSSLSAQGDVNLQTGQLTVKAVKDVSTSKTTSTEVTAGLMVSSQNKVKADANVDTAYAVNASATGGSDATSNTKLTLLKTQVGSGESLDETSRSASISSGKNLTVNAGKNLQVTGSNISAKGSATITADQQQFNASEDRHETRSNSNTTNAGIYVDLNAGAHAAGKIAASVDASAEAGAGYSVSNSNTSRVQGSTKAVVSTISAGGDLTRTAKETLADTGTAIAVGGNMTQSATTISSKAAKDTRYSTTNEGEGEGRYGVYAGATASAKLIGLSAAADASIGARVQVSAKDTETTKTANTAVVSNVKVGGAFTSASSGATQLEGTVIKSGGDTTLNAAQLDYTAARNTSTTTTTQGKGAVVLTANINAESVLGGQLSATGSGGKASTSTDTASAGSLSSGGTLKVNTPGNTRFEGTALTAAQGADIKAGGNVNFDAAASTTKSSTQDASAGLNIGATAGGTADKSKDSGFFSATGSYSQSDSSNVSRSAASITTGGNLNVSSGGNTRLEGSKINSAGETSIAAKGKLSVEAAKDTTSSTGFSAGLTGGASSTTDAKGGTATNEKTATVGAAGGYDQARSTMATGAVINAKGNIRLTSGGDTLLEGTQVKSDNKVLVQAGGKVVQKAAVSDKSSFNIQAGLTVTGKTSKTTAASDKAKNVPAPAATQDGAPPASGSTVASNSGAAAAKTAAQDTAIGGDGLGSASGTLKAVGAGSQAKVEKKLPVGISDPTGGFGISNKSTSSAASVKGSSVDVISEAQ